MLTEDYITEVYCFIDDMMKECWKNIRKRGPGPKLSDAEVITMEIAGESLGMDCDKTIHRYFRDHWRHLFPNCGFRRAHFSKLFKGEATYGYCAAKAMTYYGLKGHLLIDLSGIYGIEQFIAITGKWSASLSECVKQILCGIADKSIPLPQNSKWSEFIDYIVATGHSVNAIFNSVIDTILTGSGIDDKQFIFWGEWLLQYGILTGRQDVLRKIFPIGILKRPEAVNIILKYKEKMPAILDAAGDDSIEFKNAIIEIIVADEKSPLCSLADFLSIKVEASVKDSQGEKIVK